MPSTNPSVTHPIDSATGYAARGTPAGSMGRQPATGDTPNSHRRRHTAEKTVLATVYLLILAVMVISFFVVRYRHPQAWAWALPLMNAPLALGGEALLLLAAVAGGLGAFAAQRGRRGLAVGVALVAAGASLGFAGTVLADWNVKGFYGLRPSPNFQPNERYLARNYGVRLPRVQARQPSHPEGVHTSVALAAAAAPPRPVDTARGRRFFIGTCAGCHGMDAMGLPGQGRPLVNNGFVQSRDDAELLRFLKVGRQPWDADNSTKVAMPPRGGNPVLSDDDLRDIAAYVRTLQSQTTGAASGVGEAAHSQDAASVHPTESAMAAAEEKALFMASQRTFIPLPPTGPSGLSVDYLAESARPRWMPPPDGESFVSAYYLLTQFQVAQAGLLGLAMVALSVVAWRGRVGHRYSVPYRAAASIAACVAAFWTLVFPFLYLC